MKIKAPRRLARFAGFFAVSMLVIAIGVQTAQAMRVDASVLGTAAQATSGQSVSFLTPPAGTQGRGGVALVPLTPAAGTQGRGGVALVPAAPATSAQAVSSGTSSATAWVIIGAVAALLIIGVSAFALRRRRQAGDTASAYCVQHPDDALCRAA